MVQTMNIWDVEKELIKKGYSRCDLKGWATNCPHYSSAKDFNGGRIEFIFYTTTNGNFSLFDLVLSNRQDVKISLTKNTVDEVTNLLNKEELLKQALESAIKTLREAESSDDH